MSLHHDNTDYITALDSYANAIFVAEQLVDLTKTDDEVLVDAATELFRSLKGYEKEIATFYILGLLSACSELDDPVEE